MGSYSLWRCEGFASTFRAKLLCFFGMTRLLLIPVLIPAAAALMIATTLSAQNVPVAAGAIEGAVINSITMAPLADAPITVTSGELRIGSITDSSGRFVIPSIAPGPYTVSASLADFAGPEKRSKRRCIFSRAAKALQPISIIDFCYSARLSATSLRFLLSPPVNAA